MDHEELLGALRVRLGSKSAAEAALSSFADVTMTEVAAGGRVALAGFGVFDAIARGGQAQPRFRPGSAFRAVVADPHLLPKRGPEDRPAPRGSGRANTAGPVGTVAPRGDDVLPLRFRRFELAPEVSLSALLPEGAPRCGIYVLHFADGSAYVGQASDVLSRSARHRRRWGDRLIALAFAPAHARDLDDLERRVIQWFERHQQPLMNTALVGLPMGDSPLDLVVDRVEQERWLSDPMREYDLGSRARVAQQRPRTGEKFGQLCARPDYPGIRLALFSYVADVLPCPAETERRFWTITALPSTNRSRQQRRLSAVSVNNVETLVLIEFRDEDDQWTPTGFMNTAKGTWRGPAWRVKHAHYRTVGDVDAIYFVGWDDLVELLQRPDVMVGARRLAMGLMRKGRGMMAKYHDESLADDLFVLGANNN